MTFTSEHAISSAPFSSSDFPFCTADGRTWPDVKHFLGEALDEMTPMMPTVSSPPPKKNTGSLPTIMDINSKCVFRHREGWNPLESFILPPLVEKKRWMCWRDGCVKGSGVQAGTNLTTFFWSLVMVVTWLSFSRIWDNSWVVPWHSSGQW